MVQYTASMIHLPWAQPKYIAMSYAAEVNIYQGKGWLNTTSSFQDYISRTGGSLILPLSFSGLFSGCKGRRTASADDRARLFGTCPLCRESPPQGSYIPGWYFIRGMREPIPWLSKFDITSTLFI